MSKFAQSGIHRRLPVGAESLASGGSHFRLWAPKHQRVTVALEIAAGGKQSLELQSENNGYFSGFYAHARAGDLYRFSLNGGKDLLPDPASRFQPEGPLGPSMIVDPGAFDWNDAGWPGVRIEGQIIYEMHIGTFTAAGTWQAAAEQLSALREIGITIVEIMPVNDFCGNYGWGYDGVDFFAPTRLYGAPEDFRLFIAHAHAVGLGVILDVVYNHAGPGNYLKQFSDDYFSKRYSTEWGESFNFDGPNCAPVREFFAGNAGYWIDEFHLDGLRLDATQNIYDASKRHILVDIGQRVRQAGAGRSTIVVAENEPQNVRLICPVEDGGYGLDALWNDDFHHSAMAALTGHNEAYFSDHLGRPQEFVTLAKRSFLYQGQPYRWQKQRRGTPTYGFPHCRFINFLENHDQLANLGLGRRVHQLSHPGVYRAMTALLLLSPQTPMLFQGQEFEATSGFVFFAHHEAELADKVKEGRMAFLHQFPSLAAANMQPYLPDPGDPAAFESSRLDLAERSRNKQACALHRDLLKLRCEDPVFAGQGAEGIDGAVLADDAFVLRFFSAGGSDRLLLLNLGLDLRLSPVPEPLLAPPSQFTWQVIWSSEDPRYGGAGALAVEDDASWFVPGKATFVLAPNPS